MEYRIIKRTMTTSESLMDVEAPSIFEDNLNAGMLDRAVYDLAKANKLETQGGDTTLATETKIVEVWRGETRVFPRVRKVTKKAKATKDAAEKKA